MKMVVAIEIHLRRKVVEWKYSHKKRTMVEWTLVSWRIFLAWRKYRFQKIKLRRDLYTDSTLDGILSSLYWQEQEAYFLILYPLKAPGNQKFCEGWGRGEGGGWEHWPAGRKRNVVNNGFSSFSWLCYSDHIWLHIFFILPEIRYKCYILFLKKKRPILFSCCRECSR